MTNGAGSGNIVEHLRDGSSESESRTERKVSSTLKIKQRKKQGTLRFASEKTQQSNSGQRSLPTYYRGCWHVVSRSFLLRYRLFSSLKTEVYNPKTFFPHAASLHQSFLHCAIFPTAASRRSLGRVSVPMWPINLSVRLLIVALVSRYLTN